MIGSTIAMNTIQSTSTLMKRGLSKVILLLLMISYTVACSDNEATSVWDPNVEPPREAPQLTSITPEGGFLAGIDSITLNGTGFSSNPDEMTVYFSGTEERGLKGLIRSASPTQLVVRPPQLVEDNVEVKIALIGGNGAENFSNTLQYNLLPATLPGYSAFNDKADTPLNLALDNDGNLFVALSSGGNPQGIIRVDNTSGEVSEYVVANNRFRWDKLGFVNGRLYICVGLRAVFIGDEGQREAAHFIMPNGFEFVSFDTDDAGHMWIVGNNSHIVRHEPQAARAGVSNIGSLPPHTKIYPFTANSDAVFFFENKLYVVGNDGTSAKVWELELDANKDVVATNEFADLSVLLGDVNLSTDTFNDMSMASDGTIYIATNRSEGIIQVSPDGSSAGALYPGVVLPNVNSMYWGDNEFLYISVVAPAEAEHTNNVLRVNMQKQGAPDYK